jgi:uncharacterized protein (TIGR00730 family)
VSTIRRVCVFCGARPGRRPEYTTAARRLGRVLAAAGVELVYGGSSLGLMAEVANAVLDHDGNVTGVIPGHLLEREIPHEGLTELCVVETMHERKKLMFDLSDAFIALPGGLGTLEELSEILTWSQLGLHVKPVGLLDVADYFGGLITFLDHAVAEGFLHPEHRRLLLASDEPEGVLDQLREFEAPPTERWMDGAQR